ncbi:PTS system, cellobiose-specific IIA component [Alkalibacterium putridalgicola]|uniref:PTS cellobiose transporter subunit IIA n=1 Tax=Alkalibacterium putridalgicola TaxID=426703 RepID=A0A1H7V2R6_9LACT|nr:PTS cellobiose transporter subunit IIA [Alkalibacterium putridalgicola]SEM03434.1 PTS system, cellobiose-specific IIA component [Alkalibacterium putridalgicola]
MDDSNQEYLELVMGLITHAGNAKSLCMEAFQLAKENQFEEADVLLKEADEAINKAHNLQTSMLTKEASGETVELTLLMVHAQDHIMNAMSFKDMTEEVIYLHRELNKVK